MNHFLNVFGWTIVHSVWQLALVGAAVAASLRLAKNNSQARHNLALAGLFACAICPLLTFSALWSEPASPHRFAALAHPQVSASPMRWIVLAWAIGFVAMGLKMGGALAWIIRANRSSNLGCPPKWQEIVSRLASSLGAKTPQLKLSNRVEGPCTFGFFRPVILVPASFVSRLTAFEVEALLAHEMAHILRKDYLWNLVQSIVECALFYHPTVWLLSKVARVEREHCCDDLSSAALGGALPYAKALTRLEECRMESSLALAATGGSLKSRITRLFAPKGSPRRAGISLLPLLLVLAGLAPLGLKLAPQAKAHRASPPPQISVEATPIADNSGTEDGIYEQWQDYSGSFDKEQRQFKEDMERLRRDLAEMDKDARQTSPKKGRVKSFGKEDLREVQAELKKARAEMREDFKIDLREAMDDIEDAKIDVKDITREALRTALEATKTAQREALAGVREALKSANVERKVAAKARRQALREAQRALKESLKTLKSVEAPEPPATPKTPTIPNTPETPESPQSE